jgi:hypothetical protein
MTDPTLERATSAVGELSASVRSLTAEVISSEQLRTAKIRWIQKLLYLLIPAVALLVIMAASNFVLLGRIDRAAVDSRSTNELLLGCLRPGTTCNELNRTKTAQLLDNIRQTQFVIAVCQRQNPIEQDPSGEKLIACVQSYYPGFKLPPKTGE